MDPVLILVNIIALVVVVIWSYIKNKYSYWKNRRVPYTKPSLPYGNLKGVGKGIHTREFFSDIYEKFKHQTPFVGTYFFTEPVAVVTNFELARNILIRDSNTFQDRKEYYNENEEPLTAHMAYLGGEKWHQLHQKFEPLFKPNRMMQIMPTILEISDRLATILEPMAETGEPVEIMPVLGSFSMDIAGNIILGIKCNCLLDPNCEFQAKSERISVNPRQSELRRIFMQTYPRIARLFNMRTLFDDVSEYFIKVIRDEVKERSANSGERGDLMDLMVQLKNTGKLDDSSEHFGNLTDDEVLAQAFLFFMTSVETISTTLGSGIYQLTMHEDIQEQLRSEILDVLSKTGGQVTYDAIMKMTYLHQFVDEILRLHSPANHLIRKAAQNYKVPGTEHVIEKGTTVFIPISAFHCDPDVFPDPLVFNPDNFSSKAVAGRHPCAYLPFGEGPRGCIGTQMGKLVVYAGLVKVLSKYRVKFSDLTPLNLSYVNSIHGLRTTADYFPEFEKL